MPKKKVKKEPIKFERGFHCEKCKVDFIEGIEPLVKHLKDVHGIDAKTAKASKCLTMALDGADWYENSYRWTWPKVTVLETCRGPRKQPW